MATIKIIEYSNLTFFKRKFNSQPGTIKHSDSYPNFYRDTDYLTPKSRSKPSKADEILGNFSIPRPSIRTYV